MAKRSRKPDNKAKITGEDDMELTQDLGSRNINWFPGHMRKALTKIKDTIKQVDIILEIRDARSPLVTGNPDVDFLIGEKNKLIVLNKANLADPKVMELWQEWFEKQGQPFIFVNGLDKKSLEAVVEMSEVIVREKRNQNNPQNKAKKKLKMMVIGLPNTGKSTVINKLSNRDASKVANKPGQTQHQLWVNVNENLDILDNPGVMPHRIINEEHGIWLSVLHAIPDAVIDIERPAIYIINYLLANFPQTLKNYYKIDFETADFLLILDLIAKVRGCLRQKGEYDYDRVYRILLTDFRSGSLGHISFGLPPK